MTASGRRIFARILALVLLVVITATVAYRLTSRPTSEAVAVLRIRPAQSFMSDFAATSATRDQAAELEQYAATCAALIRARSVLRHTLRSDDVKNLKVIKDCEDPESWLNDVLIVRRPTPAVIEVAIACKAGRDGQECATLVNAVLETFLDGGGTKESGGFT